MQINNSGSNSLTYSPVSGKVKQTSVNSQREQTRAQESSDEQNKAQSSTTTPRFTVDQRAIASVEQFNQQRANNVKPSVTNADGRSYDQPSAQNQLAVNSYRSIESIAQRESIQQTFGIDLLV